MDPDVAMTIDKLPDSGGAMGREIICDNVDLLALGKAGHDLFQKSNKFRTGVTRRGLAQHLAGFGVERGVERKGAVTVVLKTVSLGSSGRERQHGIESVQSLDGALFVDAKDSRIDWRLQIQANDSLPSFEPGGQCLTRSLDANAKAELCPGRFQQT
jgi:hypothetical protein